jgi:hypothetical protein
MLRSEYTTKKPFLQFNENQMEDFSNLPEPDVKANQEWLNSDSTSDDNSEDAMKVSEEKRNPESQIKQTSEGTKQETVNPILTQENINKYLRPKNAVDYKALMNQAIEADENSKQMYNIAQGASRISDALLRQNTSDFSHLEGLKPRAVESLTKKMELGQKAEAMEREQALNDPTHPASVLLRDQFQKAFPGVKIPDNVSANDLIKGMGLDFDKLNSAYSTRMTAEANRLEKQRQYAESKSTKEQQRLDKLAENQQRHEERKQAIENSNKQISLLEQRNKDLADHYKVMEDQGADKIELKRIRDEASINQKTIDSLRNDQKLALQKQEIEVNKTKGFNDKYNTLMKKDYSSLQQAMTNAQRADEILNNKIKGRTPGTEDIQLLYNFIKGLDKNSAVREGEIKLSEQARSLIGLGEAKFKSLFGGDILDTRTRKSIAELIKASADAERINFIKQKKNYLDSGVAIGLDREALDKSLFGEHSVLEYERNQALKSPVTQKQIDEMKALYLKQKGKTINDDQAKQLIIYQRMNNQPTGNQKPKGENRGNNVG